MKTIEINLYKFEELSKEAQQKAIDKWYENEDYPFLGEELKERCINLLEDNKVEYSDIKLYYSLSYSQGDGLCFIGDMEKNGTKLQLTHTWRYYFASSVTMGFYDSQGEEIEEENEATAELKEIYFDICSALEKQGYAEIEYRMNIEEFTDLCEANDYYFLANGIMKNS